MYKVFLVDDEIVVREGIRSNFPWEDTQFVLSGEAPDGEIALDMIKDIKPDILITDIRMPFMDGMELCRRVSRTMPWIYIVILSGYDDFSYAREAISLGVKEYLLKPVSGQELLQVLERIAAKIREDRTRQSDFLFYRERLESTGRLIQEKLLDSLFAGAPSAETLKRADAANMHLSAKKYMVMLIRPADSARTREEIMSVAGNLSHLADESAGTVYMRGREGRFTVLVLADSDVDLEESAYAFAQAAQYEVGRNTGVPLLFAIGTPVDQLEDVPASLARARAVIDHLEHVKDDNRNLRIMSYLDVAPFAPVVLPNIDGPISDALMYASTKDVDAILDNYLRHMGESARQSIVMANYVFMDILLAASRIIRESGGDPQSIIPESVQERARINTVSTIDELLPQIRDVLVRAITFRDQRQSTTRYGALIGSAKAFILKEYANSNLTLHDVASHVALSNNHFCTIFSQETGVTFTEYLTAIRLGKAKEFLKNTSMRTADIAYSVGYNDPHYFSYLFKKNEGVSPRDYRREGKTGVLQP